MSSIVNRFIIVVCAVVSLTYSSDVITNANWSVSGESSAFWYDMTCGPLAMAVDKSGNIYASQWDLLAGGRYIRGIAKWDQHQWTEFVPGIETEPVKAMVFDSAGNMYVGGNYVQKFDGVSWQKIGNEHIGWITELAINNRGELFAGTLKNQDLSYVCKWSDTAWVIIGEFPRGNVKGLACDSSGNLFVCGHFGFIWGSGSNSVNSVAKWDGSTWSSLGGGCWRYNNSGDSIVGDVINVKCIGNDVYFAGEFENCGSKNIRAVARWDGCTWNNVGNGTAYSVYQLATDKYGSLYASGSLSLQNEEPGNVMKLVNDEWMVLDSLDTLYTVNFIIDSSGSIFSLGWKFSQLVDGMWSMISNGEGFAGDIYAFAYDRLSGYLYAGGSFEGIGNKRINNIARWDGKSWSNLGNGISSSVLSLAVGKDGTVYAGGTTCGEEPNTAISAWNGESWTEIAQFKQKNSCCHINSLAFDSVGNMYAGGAFTALNDIPVRNIARWDGKTWNALGDGIDGFNVNALAIDKKGILYAGGNFDKAGTEVCHNIARWDGTAWSGLGEGVTNNLSVFANVNALVIDSNGDLYTGGEFSMAGGIDAHNIAKWNGVSWSSLGSGSSSITGYINALSLDEDGNLYAGGEFKFIDTLSVNGVARWNGTMWEPLGDGVKISNYLDDIREGIVYALQCNGKGMMYTGGNFNYAGGKISNSFAQCNLNGPLKLIPSKNKKSGNTVINKRNDGLVLVRSNDIMSIGYRIYSLSGRQLNYERITIPAGDYVLKLKTAGLAKGTYIADIRAGEASLQYRFVNK